MSTDKWKTLYLLTFHLESFASSSVFFTHPPCFLALMDYSLTSILLEPDCYVISCSHTKIKALFTFPAYMQLLQYAKVLTGLFTQPPFLLAVPNRTSSFSLHRQEMGGGGLGKRTGQSSRRELQCSVWVET